MTNKNGFEIDLYNQYGLKDGAKYSTCPLCSEHRKKKQDKCAQLFWDSGLGYCNHCGERFQLHTYKKKEKERKISYRKPTEKPKKDLSTSFLNWFYNRGISKETLELANVQECVEWMPQTQEEEKCIAFNYLRDGELVNVKYRTISSKSFKLE